MRQIYNSLRDIPPWVKPVNHELSALTYPNTVAPAPSGSVRNIAAAEMGASMERHEYADPSAQRLVL